jgi:hypothetical protein
MEDSNIIDKANKVGSAINNWAKIGSIIIAAVVSCTYAYYLIIGNSSDISDMKKDMENLKEDYKRQYKTFGDKEEKKESQYKEAGKIYMDWMLKHEDRLREIEVENAYQKGILEDLKHK